jgi:surface antigen
MWRFVALLMLLLAAGCASRGPERTGRHVPAPEGGDLSCVPYARSRSGLPLRGDAWQWWEAAAGNFQRDRRPRPGSVLVLMRNSRLPQGHVAVVARVVSAREILVDHANWASGRAKGQVARAQPVQDISPGNDWSLVRVWYSPVNDFGASNYPAFGFIHATQMASAP